MAIQPPKNLKDFQALVEVVEHLRGPQGCPWDKAQSLQSLTRFAIEEACEYAQSVETHDPKEMASELGDVLLQVVLNSQVAKEEGLFELSDVIESINEKMIRRHPHVFSDTVASTEDEVKKNWDEIKAQEKDRSKKGDATNPFDLPQSLPALQYASKIGSKTKKLAFDWPDYKGVWEKVHEEIEELSEELPHDKKRCQEELGDVLFSLAQLARHLDLDPEQCLRQANKNFEQRFVRMKKLTPEGQDFESLKDEDKEALWKKAKQ